MFYFFIHAEIQIKYSGYISKEKNNADKLTRLEYVKIPSNFEVPLFVKDEFSKFYTSLFESSVKKENMQTVFLEYYY